MNHSVTINYGDEVLASLGISSDEFSEQAKWLLAIKLYELGKLSAGQAAKLCGKGKVEFLHSLPLFGVPSSNLRPEDIGPDIEFALNG